MGEVFGLSSILSWNYAACMA